MKYEIGARLKHYRENLRLAQKDMAAELGISVQKLSNWENGANRPNVEMLPKICCVLGISPNELLQTPSSEIRFSEAALNVARVYDSLPPAGRAALDAFVMFAESINNSKEM